MPPIILEDCNLEAAERRLIVAALGHAGNIVGAARLLGITRHALKRRLVKHGIRWSRAHQGMIGAPVGSPAELPP